MPWLIGILALAAAAVGGCGDSGPVVTDRDGELRIELAEYRIVPERIRVREGRIHIVARNTGRLTHNLAIQPYERREGEVRFTYERTDTAQPGETVSTSVILGPGRYRMVCTIANHDDLGQFGELRVTPAS